MGNVTNFIDGKGNEKIITYTIRGQVAKVTYPDGSSESNIYTMNGQLQSSCSKNGTMTSFTYDALGRTVKTEITSPSGEILSITSASYNAFHIMSETDAMGQTTYYSYYPNGKLKSKRSGDSLSSCTYDALGRLKSSCAHYGPNPEDVIIKAQEYDLLNRVIEERTYDLNGNYCRLTDTIISKTSERVIVTKLSYDMFNRIIACNEAADTPEQKCTQIHYNIFGQKTSTIKADGTSLNYTYDALGRLASLSSSDNTIHYAYTYDLNNHPLKVDDLVRNTATIKEYDGSGRVTKEILGHGFSLKYDYDAMGRPTHVSLPDGSGFVFKYRAHLEKVQRVSADDVITYEHVYNSYDLSGRLITATLIGKAGNLNYSYDKNGRLKNAHSSSWEETLAYDAVGNLIEQRLKNSQGDAFTRYSYNDLYQLRLEEGVTTHDYQYDSLHNRIQSVME